MLLWLPGGASLRAASLDVWRWSNPLPQGNDLHALIHANGRIVAVGDHGSILQSFDGTDWSVHNLEMDVDFYSVAFGNGMLVGVGNDSPSGTETRAGVLTSSDGTNWALHNTGASGSPSRVTEGNGRFVAVGSLQRFYRVVSP